MDGELLKLRPPKDEDLLAVRGLIDDIPVRGLAVRVLAEFPARLKVASLFEP
jgi:hypothetical protein